MAQLVEQDAILKEDRSTTSRGQTVGFVADRSAPTGRQNLALFALNFEML